jgi:hypothetical protein
MTTKGLGLWLGSAKVEVLLKANTNYKEQYKKLTSVKPKTKKLFYFRQQTYQLEGAGHKQRLLRVHKQ